MANATCAKSQIAVKCYNLINYLMLPRHELTKTLNSKVQARIISLTHFYNMCCLGVNIVGAAAIIFRSHLVWRLVGK